MFERELRAMSDVPRWTTLRTIQKQNVAEHTFYVLFYSRQILDFFEQGSAGFWAEVMLYALVHDMDEIFTGDIPGPWKRKLNVDSRPMEDEILAKLFGPSVVRSIFKLSEEARIIVKIADLIDECLWLASDIQLGNAAVDGVLTNSFRNLTTTVASLPLTIATQEQREQLFTEISGAIHHHRYGRSRYLTG